MQFYFYMSMTSDTDCVYGDMPYRKIPETRYIMSFA